MKRSPTVMFALLIAALTLVAGCGPAPQAAQPPPPPPESLTMAPAAPPMTALAPTGAAPTTAQPAAAPAPPSAAAVITAPVAIPTPPTPGGTPPPPGVGDERVLYLRTVRSPQREILRQELWSVALDGSDEGLVAAATCPTPCLISRVAIAPDGAQIAYVVEGEHAPMQGLHLIGADGTNDRVLVEGGVTIDAQAFSPDGSRLALYRSAPEHAIWVVATSGGQLRQVVPAGSYPRPAWLDDQHIAFSQSSGAGSTSAESTYQVSIAGATPPELLSSGSLLAVSPDRTALLVLVAASAADAPPLSHRLGFVSLTDRQLRLLTEAGAMPRSVSWAPDSAALALFDEATGSLERLQLSNGAHELLLRFPLEGGPVFDTSVWSAGGRSLIYSVKSFGQRTELRRLDLDTRAEQTLTVLPHDPAIPDDFRLLGIVRARPPTVIGLARPPSVPIGQPAEPTPLAGCLQLQLRDFLDGQPLSALKVRTRPAAEEVLTTITRGTIVAYLGDLRSAAIVEQRGDQSYTGRRLVWVRVRVGQVEGWASLRALKPACPPPGGAAATQADLARARAALITFSRLLHDQRYAEAVAVYGGSYAELQAFDPHVPIDDFPALLKRGCEGGWHCLSVKRVVQEEALLPDEFVFLVEFANDDGTRFTRGPCCGASEAQMPTQTQFEVRVRKAGDRMLVLTLPVYTP